MRGSGGGKQYVIARGSQILPSADLPSSQTTARPDNQPFADYGAP